MVGTQDTQGSHSVSSRWVTECLTEQKPKCGHHLSFPDGGSVNGFTPSEFCSVHYATGDDAVCVINKLCPGCTLAKTDVRRTFRIIPVRPNDYHLFRVCDEGPSTMWTTVCQRSAVRWNGWLVTNKISQNVIHFLEDFLITAESPSQCKADLQNFLKLCKDISVPMAPEKAEGRALLLTFAGIELDC